MSEITGPDRIANIERMIILIALDEYAGATKDADQRRAILGLRQRLNQARTITLESMP